MRLLFLCLLMSSSFSTSIFPMAGDNYLRSFAEENSRRMQQIGTNEKVHIIVYLDHEKTDKILVFQDKDEKEVKKEDAIQTTK